jgi:flagellar biosynthesis/type III secretory pathway chaperone
MDMKQRLADLVVIASRLVEILDNENKALRSHKPAEIAKWVADKASLSRAYESRLRGVAENPAELAEADGIVHEKLHALGERLRTLADENARLLKVAMAAHNEFVGAVANAVRQSSAGPGLYSRKGATASPQNGSRPRPVSLDRTL